MAEDKDLYDFSNYPKDHFLYFDVNKKVIRKFKDDCACGLIKEYVGLRPKMYSILLDDKTSLKRAKRVMKSVLKKEILPENYKEVLSKMYSILLDNTKSIKGQSTY